MTISSSNLKSLQNISTFLTNIGFSMKEDSIPSSFLPGVELRENMVIAYDPRAIVCAGDILHEAGHLAIIPSLFRHKIAGNVDECLEPLADAYFKTHPFHTGPAFQEDAVCRALLQADEQAAQAWSYAAAIEAGIDPKYVFDSQSLDDPFSFAGILIGLQVKCHPGINSMAAAGITDRNIFPKMHRWLQL